MSDVGNHSNEESTQNIDQNDEINKPNADVPLCMQIPSPDDIQCSKKASSETKDEPVEESSNNEKSDHKSVNQKCVLGKSLIRPVEFFAEPRDISCSFSRPNAPVFLFNSRISNKNTSVLCPSKLQNAFVKLDSDKEKQLNGTEETKNNSKTPECPSELIGSSNKNEESSALCFVPLKTSASLTSSSSTSSLINTTPSTPLNLPVSTVCTKSLSSDFVFGQNLHERIIKEESSAISSLVSNGISSSDSSMLFKCMLKDEDKEINSDSNSSSSSSDKKSLSESAKEYEESRLSKRKFEEVPLITGEENETNVLQMNCKLFTFDNNTSNWSEKGRGILRVNRGADSWTDKSVDDEDIDCSYRLIMRLSGSYRVILNAKVWNGMVVERANKKSLRFTAPTDDNNIKIHLIVGPPSDVDTLQNIINSGIQKKKKFCSDNSNN